MYNFLFIYKQLFQIPVTTLFDSSYYAYWRKLPLIEIFAYIQFIRVHVVHTTVINKKTCSLFSLFISNFLHVSSYQDESSPTIACGALVVYYQRDELL